MSIKMGSRKCDQRSMVRTSNRNIGIGNMRFGLFLGSRPDDGSIIEEEIIQVLNSVNAPSIAWSFTDFSTGMLQDAALMQLTLCSGNGGDGLTSVSSWRIPLSLCRSRPPTCS